MIKLNNVEFKHTKISLLANYKYQTQNMDFVNIINKFKSDQIDNPTIKKGISDFIKDRKLDSDPLFLNQGILTNETKDLIEISLVSRDNTYYVYNYEVIEKTTDVKYKGIPAAGYSNSLNRYKRYAKDKEIDFELVTIHEMGYAVDAANKSGTLIKNGDSVEIDMVDFLINDNRNPILADSKYFMLKTLDAEIPDYLVVKGERLYALKPSKEIVIYIDNLLSTNTFFSYVKNSLEIIDEIIYFDSYNILERVVIDYLIKQLKTNIIPIKEILNIIDILFSIEGVEINQQVHALNILDKLDKEIERDKEARRHYFFAKDILLNASNINTSTVHFKDRKGTLKQLLIEMLGINEKTKKVYVASQYLLMKYFSNDIEMKMDKKNRIISTLVELSKKYNFELFFIAKTKRQATEFSIIQSDFHNVHGRYVITVDEKENLLKFDAELDHFDDEDDTYVNFRDISYMHLKSENLLPISIRRVVGEIK